MVQFGTEFIELDAALPTLPPAAHDASTALRAPGIHRPTLFAVMLAKVCAIWLDASPLERSALLGVASIWIMALLIVAVIAGILSYDVFSANRDLAKQVRSFTPPVHIGIESLLSATPATPAP